MSFRIYDRRKGRWIRDNIYLAPNGNVFKLDKNIFKNKEKLVQVSNERFVYHRDIGLVDRDYDVIYEGDIAEAEIADNEFIIVEIAYLNQIASYAALDYKTDNYYELNEERCKYIKIIGNVFDTPELLDIADNTTIEEVEKS